MFLDAMTKSLPASLFKREEKHSPPFLKGSYEKKSKNRGQDGGISEKM
jgi:hypothetical protein